MAVLVPSNQEEPATLRRALLSAALQEFGFLQVVLLLEPPTDSRLAHAAHAVALDLPATVANYLAVPRERFAHALDMHQHSSRIGEPTAEQVRAIAAEYRWAAGWLRMRAEQELRLDHLDDFFVDHVLESLASDLDGQAESLLGDTAGVTVNQLDRLYRRLAWIFRAEISCFDRARYPLLSQARGPAAGLDSYRALMGQSFDVVDGTDGQQLVPAGNRGSIRIPAADYVLALDPDSMLLPEYCLRLLERTGLARNERANA
jgi:cellulose synthase (UDP-forming)